jgi:hypothetical protein
MKVLTLALRAVPLASSREGSVFPSKSRGRVTLSFGLIGLALALSSTQAQTWQTHRSPNFIVQTASQADTQYLEHLFQTLQSARKDLKNFSLEPPGRVLVVVHPSLESYRKATAQPWFVLAQANRAEHQIDVQRLHVVAERGQLEAVLRHEYFHLAQPEDWPRWLAEGSAMIFAGQKPTAKALEGVSATRLEEILANPPNSQTLARAMAGAYERARAYWKKRGHTPYALPLTEKSFGVRRKTSQIPA